MAERVDPWELLRAVELRAAVVQQGVTVYCTFCNAGDSALARYHAPLAHDADCPIPAVQAALAAHDREGSE